MFDFKAPLLGPGLLPAKQPYGQQKIVKDPSPLEEKAAVKTSPHAAAPFGGGFAQFMAKVAELGGDSKAKPADKPGLTTRNWADLAGGRLTGGHERTDATTKDGTQAADTQRTTASISKIGGEVASTHSHTDKKESGESTTDTRTTTGGIDKKGNVSGSRTSAQEHTDAQGNTTSNSKTIGAGLGPSSVSAQYKQSHAEGNDQNGSATESSTAAQVGPDSIGGSHTHTARQTRDGKTDETTRGVHGEVDPSTGAVTAGGSYNKNGRGGSLDAGTGPGGPHIGGDVHGRHVGVGGELGPNTTAAHVDLTAGKANFGLSYQNVHDKWNPAEVHKAADGGVVADVLGKDYLSRSREDSTQYGASAAIRGSYVGVSLSGDLHSGHALEAFDSVNPGKLDAAQRSKIGQDEKARLSGVNGLADIKLGQMKEGSGIRYSGYNGWNVDAGLTLGAVGVSGGGGKTSAHDVAIAKQDGRFQVSMASQNSVENHAGVDLAKIAGLTDSNQESKTHKFQFSVDPDRPHAMQAMHQFMQTGLLPGTDRLKSPGAVKAQAEFTNGVSEVKKLNQQIADQQRLMGTLAKDGRGRGLGPGSVAAEATKLNQMRGQLDSAQSSIDINRSFLNDQWKDNFTVGKDPMPGVKISNVSDTKTETNHTDASFLGFHSELGRDEQSWTDRQFLSAHNRREQGFSYEHLHTSGGRTEQQNSDSSTDRGNVSWSMGSDNTFGLASNNKNTGDILKTIQNRNVPDYVLNPDGDKNSTHNISGHTQVDLDVRTMNAMGNALNDPKNKDSAKLWKDMALRDSEFITGQMFSQDWKGPGDTTTGKKQPGVAPGQAPHKWDFETRKMFFEDMNHGDPQNPTVQALEKLGVHQNELHPGGQAMEHKQWSMLGQDFAKIKNASDFQKLPPAEQQVFIEATQRTSGLNADATGKRNPYEAIAPVMALKDPAARANGIRNVFVGANTSAKAEQRDAVTEFVQFSDRFKSSPATYDLIQNSMSFDWRNQGVDKLQGKKSGELTQNLQDAYNHTDHPFLRASHHNPDEGRMLDTLMAANQQGGTKELKQVIAQSKIQPGEMLDSFKDKSTQQHLYYDLLKQAGFADPNQGAGLGFESHCYPTQNPEPNT